MRGDNLLRQGQHQAAVLDDAGSDALLVKCNLNLLEINHLLLGPERRELKTVVHLRR